MLKLTLLLFFNISLTLAYDIGIEGEGDLQNCSSDSSEKLFYCQNSKGEEFLITEKHWEFVALKRDSSGKYKPAEVYFISDKAGGEIFSAGFNRARLMPNDPKPIYQGLINDYINNERYLYSTFFNEDQKSLNVENKKFKRFYNNTKFELEKKKEKVEQVLKQDDFKLKLKDGQEVKCVRNTNKECPLIDCKDDAQGIERKILSSNSPFYLYMESFGFENGNFTVPENTTIGLYSTDGNELIKYADHSPEAFSPNMLVPSDFKSNPRLFNSLRDPAYLSYLKTSLSSCGPKILNKFLEIAKKTHEDLSSSSMLQYIDLVNGILKSNYINKDSIPGNSCYYKGAYYGPEGYQKALELEVMSKKTISLEEAQELFDEARMRKDIAWDYTYDGCYARAHLMARMFEEAGVHVDKAWLRGSLSIPGEKDGMYWGYHVAPVVYVEGKNGKVQEMIIDPSVSKKPITPSEWATIMKVDFKETEKVSFPTPNNTAFYNKTSYSVTNSTPYWPEYNEQLTEDNKIDMAKKTMLDYGGAPQEDDQWQRWE